MGSSECYCPACVSRTSLHELPQQVWGFAAPWYLLPAMWSRPLCGPTAEVWHVVPPVSVPIKHLCLLTLPDVMQ